MDNNINFSSDDFPWDLLSTDLIGDPAPLYMPVVLNGDDRKSLCINDGYLVVYESLSRMAVEFPSRAGVVAAPFGKILKELGDIDYLRGEVAGVEIHGEADTDAPYSYVQRIAVNS